MNVFRPSAYLPPPDRTMLRRTIFLLVVLGVFAFALIAAKLFDLQILRHEELESAAVAQQLRSVALPAARGTITDRNGTILAQSASAYAVYLVPSELRRNGEDASFIAEGLADILKLDAAKLLALTEKKGSYYVTVARRIEAESADAVRRFKSENGIRSIRIETDTKRYYPCGSLAAHLIGFVGADDTGLSGIEYSFNDTLTGKSGRVSRLKNSAGGDMLFPEYESTIPAENGKDLILTLDASVQYLLEKHLKQAVADYDVRNGAAAIAVDPRNGGILAMVSLGDFDLNDYQQVSEKTMERMNAAADETERARILAAAQQLQWRNKAVSDTYEPGSTFKIITLAMALEEGICNENSRFYCGGTTSVPGRGKPLKCWKSAGHGSQDLTQAAQHSCNVAFTQLGLRIGEERFYKYCEAFGFFRADEDPAARLTGRTGIALPGESGSIWWSRNVFCNPDNLSQLAAASFGQTFNVTPLQLVMAISACCNGGTLMQPRLIEASVDNDGNKEYNGPIAIRQVISEETSRRVRRILEQVVCDKKEGTGRNAYVAGYRIGGKTGTSEKVAQDVSGGEKEYIVSFVGIAPIDDPEIVVLVLLDTPSNETGIYISGGQMAAPVVGRFLAEALPAMGILPSVSEEEAAVMDRAVPKLVGLSVTESAELLAEAGLRAHVIGAGEYITAQQPEPGSFVACDTAVTCYAGSEAAETMVYVPNLAGLRYEEARRVLESSGLFLAADNSEIAEIESAQVASQSEAAGTLCTTGSIVRVTLAEHDERNYGRY